MLTKLRDKVRELRKAKGLPVAPLELDKPFFGGPELADEPAMYEETIEGQHGRFLDLLCQRALQLEIRDGVRQYDEAVKKRLVGFAQFLSDNFAARVDLPGGERFEFNAERLPVELAFPVAPCCEICGRAISNPYMDEDDCGDSDGPCRVPIGDLLFWRYECALLGYFDEIDPRGEDWAQSAGPWMPASVRVARGLFEGDIDGRRLLEALQVDESEFREGEEPCLDSNAN